MSSATNAGIARAMVVIFGGAPGFRFTDTGGNFEVDNLSCSPYTLLISKPGFVSGQEQNQVLANRAPGSPPEEPSDASARPPAPATQFVNLKPDSPRVRIALIPVASIIGTVLDENGEPLAGVNVQAIAVKTSLSGTDYQPSQTAQSDDRGHYELLNLTPGDFLVRLAGESSSTAYFQGSLNLNNDHRGMQPVYYPNANSESSASVVSLAPGVQTTADFRQATEPAFDVNGRLLGFLPQTWTRVQLYRDGDRIPIGRAFVNTTTGQFRLTDVPRGNYTLRVLQYQADSATWLAAEQPLTVIAEPIRNFAVQLSGGADIPVTVSYEAGAQEDAPIQLSLQPQHSQENIRNLTLGQRQRFAPSTGAAPPPIQPPGNQPQQSQTLSNVIPDKYKLVAQMNGRTNSYIAAAKLGDVDALHGEFEIGASPGELHLTIRGDSASVEGQVTFEGKPALGAWVYLIPTSGDGAEMKMGFGDQQGHYAIKGVPPGDYRVRAWAGMPSPKETLSGGGDTITLGPSEKQTVDLEAVPAESKSAVVQ